MAESGGLLNRCTGLNLYPGFESLPHRQFRVVIDRVVVPGELLNCPYHAASRPLSTDVAAILA